MIVKDDVKSLREVFNASTLMAAGCGLVTAGIFYGTQDPQIIMGGGSVAAAGLAFGLIKMAQAAYYLKKQGVTIYKRNMP